MKTVKVCDPVKREPFPSFLHNTTTYVSIPHCHPSQLRVESDEPCEVAIEIDGRVISTHQVGLEAVHLPLSDLDAPASMPTSLRSFITSVIQRKPNCAPRLYAFSVVFRQGTSDRAVAATFDFHVLCPTEYGPAEAYHLELQSDPDAIAPDAISDRTEGEFCPECRAVRLRLEN